MTTDISKVVEENEVFIGKKGEVAITSPLLECAGLFIYSRKDKKGVLAHWEDKGTLEKKLAKALSRLNLKNPHAIIAGCGVPMECTLDASETYAQVSNFLDENGIPIRHEEVGLNHPVQLRANFSDGNYEITSLGSLTTSYFAVSEKVEGTKIAVVRHKMRFIPSEYEWMPKFAPSDNLLTDYRKGLHWSKFVQRYTAEQRQHFKQKPEDFAGLLERAQSENLVLCCYERFDGKKTHCHRVPLYDIFKKVATNLNMDINFIDETPYQRKQHPQK